MVSASGSDLIASRTYSCRQFIDRLDEELAEVGLDLGVTPAEQRSVSLLLIAGVVWNRAVARGCRLSSQEEL